jgi:hypothetical protein
MYGIAAVVIPNWTGGLECHLYQKQEQHPVKARDIKHWMEEM